MCPAGPKALHRAVKRSGSTLMAWHPGSGESCQRQERAQARPQKQRAGLIALAFGTGLARCPSRLGAGASNPGTAGRGGESQYVGASHRFAVRPAGGAACKHAGDRAGQGRANSQRGLRRRPGIRPAVPGRAAIRPAGPRTGGADRHEGTARRGVKLIRWRFRPGVSRCDRWLGSRFACWWRRCRDRWPRPASGIAGTSGPWPGGGVAGAGGRWPGSGVAVISGRWPGGGVARAGGWWPGGGPPAGAGAHVTAVPADVGAAAAAVGDLLGGGQDNAAQPAAFYQVVLLVNQIWLSGACHPVHLRATCRGPGPTAGASHRRSAAGSTNRWSLSLACYRPAVSALPAARGHTAAADDISRLVSGVVECLKNAGLAAG